MNSERLWIEQAQAGDLRAFEKLVKAYQGSVYNLTYRMLGNAGDAEDAAQETFLRAYSNLSSYDPQRKFSSWLFAIASNYCVDQLRRRRLNWLSVEELPPWEPLRSETPDPEEYALQQADSRQVQALLDTLPPDYRLVVVLRYWHEHSYQEIAEITQSTVGAVKSRLHRARRMLAEALAASNRRSEPEPPPETQNPSPKKGESIQCFVPMPVN